MNKLYQLYFESEDGLLRHVCICTVDQVKDILEHYGELWETIVDRNLSLDLPYLMGQSTIPCEQVPINLLTSDPILQNWESAVGQILEDLETGEQFVYTYGWSDETDGYWCELLPYKEKSITP